MFIAKNSPLHHLNPLTKAIFFLSVVLVAFIAPGEHTALLIFAGALLPISLWAGLWPEMLKASLKLVLPVAAALFVVQGLFFPGGGGVIPLFGPFSLQVEGLLFAYRTTARLLVMVAAFSLFLISTDPGNLMSELIHAGLPPAIAYVVMASLMIVPEMSHKATAILEAQRARGLRTSGSLLQRTRAVFPLVAPLLLGTLMIAEERAIALEARAFNTRPHPTFWEEIADSQGQRGFRWLCLIIVIVIAGVRLWL